MCRKSLLIVSCVERAFAQLHGVEMGGGLLAQVVMGW